MSSQLQVSGEAKIRDIQGPVVANSGVITALDGAANQYVRGDGTLAIFPTSTGGGSSVSYYLNGSVNQGTFGGSTYYQMSRNAIVGTGTNFSTSSDGLIAQFITDANDPDVVSIPSGNWNVEFFMNVSASSGALASFYVEIYKYDGSTFTLLATNVATPEQLTNTTTVDAYFTSVAMPLSAMAITDRLAIRIFANVASKTVTLYTEDNRLCQIVTTFSNGLTSLNNLTDQSQYLTTGTSGTDFNIVSSGDTHTFNIPIASASNTGKLSSTDWSTFNNKVPYTGATASVDLGIYSLSGSELQADGAGSVAGFLYLKQNTLISQYLADYSAIGAYSNGYVFNIATSSVSKQALLDLSSITASASRTYTLPDANGTVALTSDLSAYLPLTGGTLTGGLNGTTATFSGLGTFYQLTMTGATAGRLFYAQTGGVFSQSGNLVWDNTNEMLGVGTPNPSALVTAFSTNAATQFKAAGTAPAFTFSNTLTSASLACVFGLATANNHFVTGTAAGDMAIANQSTSPGAIIFGTGTFEKMRMSSTGNFGIGTSSPTAKLDVNGEIRMTGSTLFRGMSSSTLQLCGGLSSSNVKIDGSTEVVTIDTNGATRLTIASTGAATFSSSVSIGGANQDYQLDVKKTSTGDSTFDTIANFYKSSTNNTQLLIRAKNSLIDFAGSYIIGGGGPNTALSFSVSPSGGSPTEAMRITSGGNVGIGTSSPNDYSIGSSAKVLQVTGSGYGIVNANAGSVTAWIIADTAEAATGTSSNHPFKITTNNVERMRITSGGNVLINKSSPRGNEYLGIESSGNEFCNFQSTGGVRAFRVNNIDVEGFNTSGTAIFVGKSNSTGRSINAGGTINASGADYAEYMTKAIEDVIAKGDIAGVDENGLLTNIFADSKSFVVKSTDPSYVGGDTWGAGLEEQELETARTKVDRIAFSGQVPCNVYNAQVGDYIVPIQLDGKIIGQAVSNPTFEQYQISVGKVWKIMEDGRAWIAVKIG